MNHACINGIRRIMSHKDSHKSEMADTAKIRLATLGIFLPSNKLSIAQIIVYIDHKTTKV